MSSTIGNSSYFVYFKILFCHFNILHLVLSYSFSPCDDTAIVAYTHVNLLLFMKDDRTTAFLTIEEQFEEGM
jgi:hypothetical protein